jgi:four helix bundle protein
MAYNQEQYRKFENELTEFGKEIIKLCKSLKLDPINEVLIKQLVRSGTSLGANYREANECMSKKDFIYRLRIVRKEAKETHHWLELLIEANPEYKTQINQLFNKANEYQNIFSAMIFNSIKKINLIK